MNVTKIISIGLFLCSLGLGFYLVSNIKSTIDERALIEEREAAIIDKLQFIREAQIAYLEVNGNYTSDWDKLIDFIENGSFPIVEKKEIVVTLSYGADSSIISYDTLEIISAKERIFKQAHNVNAANNGTFIGFSLSEGEMGVKGAVAYNLNQKGKSVGHKFKQSGVVTNQESLSAGDKVIKGDLLMTIVETKFDPNIDISRIAYVPGYTDVKFEIFAAELDKNNVIVDVVEVKNPRPFNPERKDSNEANNKRPLRFGSKTEVTTSGNWE